MAKAVWGGKVIAESDTVIVEAINIFLRTRLPNNF